MLCKGILRTMALLRTVRRGCFASINQPAFCLRSSVVRNGPEIQLARPFQTLKSGPSKLFVREAPIYNALRNAAASANTGSSTTLWIAERALSAALIGIVPAALMFPSKPLDALLAVSMVAHTYWGFEAIISEYVRTLLFGPVVPKIAHGVVIALMVTTLGGLFYLIFNDIGLAESIRRFWSIKPKA